MKPGAVPEGRNIVLRYKDGRLNHISDTSPAYHPLYYVLLFPHGDRSWSYDIPKQAREQPDANNEDMAEDFVEVLVYFSYICCT